MPSLDALEARLTRSRDRYNQAAWQAARDSEDAEKAAKIHANLDALVTGLSGVVAALTQVEQAARGSLAGKVEQAATSALRAVLGRPDYRVRIETGERAGRPTAKVLVSCETGLEAEPLDGFGGGVADLVSFALRAAFLASIRPRLAPVLVLDEPFRHVAQVHMEAASELLVQVARRLGCACLVVTHQEALAAKAGVVYRAARGPQGTEIERIR